MSQIQNEKEAEIAKMVCFESATIEKGVNETDLQDVMSVVSKKVSNDEEEMERQELLIAKLQALLKKVETKKQYIEQTSEYLTEVRRKKKEASAPKKVSSPTPSTDDEDDDDDDDDNVKNSSEDSEKESDKAPLLSQKPTLPSFMGMEEVGRIDLGDGGSLSKYVAASTSVPPPPAADDDIVIPAGNVQRRKRARQSSTSAPQDEEEHAVSGLVHFNDEAPLPTLNLENFAAATAADTSFIAEERPAAVAPNADDQEEEEEDDDDDDEEGSSGKKKKGGLAGKRQVLIDFAMYDGKRVVHPAKVMEARYVEEFYDITVHPRKYEFTLDEVEEKKAINDFLDDLEPTDAQRAHLSADVLLNCKNKPVEAVICKIEDMINKKEPIDNLWAFVNSLYAIMLKRSTGTSCNAFNSVYRSLHTIKRRKYNLDWERAEISECDKPKSKRAPAKKAGKK